MSQLVEQDKPRRSPAVAKAEAVANMKAALAGKQARQRGNPWVPPVEATTTDLAAAIESILTKHAERYANTNPEWLLDRDIRKRYFPGLSRSTYWQITKRPDYPKATVVSPKVRLRKRVEIERGLAEQPQAA
jgi:hypothetical protein